MNHESRLIQELLIRGPTTARELSSHLGISQATLSRSLARLKDRIQVFGKGRSTFYAVRRNVRTLGSRFHLLRVDQKGRCHSVGELNAVAPKGYVLAFVESSGFEIFSDLPFFLDDVKPQGYLGRSFSKRYPELALPKRLTDWNGDDVLEALCRRGQDNVGNLLVGAESFELFQQRIVSSSEVISDVSRADRYEKLATAALEGDVAGSSAGGEQPKFLLQHVLVKFSPPLKTEAGRRWADLLVCESIAMKILGEFGISSARSEVIEGADRVFLEVLRFDRVGAHGRVGTISLGALDDEWFGRRDSWISAASRLLERGAIDLEDASAMRFLDSFGGLIANSDRHFGNLSFFWEIGNQKVKLAPSYDMLPMLYAPVEGQVFQREFKPEPAKIDAIEEWNRALSLAKKYWETVIADKRISKDFRNIAEKNSAELKKL
jgi:hypothetical protein